MPNITRGERFTCPTLCGCVVELTNEWDADGQVVQNQAPTLIVSVCPLHAALDTPAALYDEIKHFHGTVWRPDTCKCSVHYAWDDRLPPEDREHAPVEHPTHTKRCKGHAKHKHGHEHHDAVVAHNRAKNAAKLN